MKRGRVERQGSWSKDAVRCGELAEWLKAPDSKSGDGKPFGGSNPSLSAKLHEGGKSWPQAQEFSSVGRVRCQGVSSRPRKSSRPRSRSTESSSRKERSTASSRS